MSDALLVRAVSVYGPIAVLAVLWGVRSTTSPVTPRELAAALLATIWNAIALLLVHAIAVDQGWWRFAVGGPAMLGFPVDLAFGWVLLWGAIPVLGLAHVPLIVVVGLLFVVDLVAMPLCAPVVTLGPHWIAGEALAIGISLVPSQLLARWTMGERALPARVALQVVGFATMMLWLLPALIFDRLGGGFDALFARDPHLRNLALQALAIPAIVGLSAVCEFVTRGGGTPIPFDPPRRLVTTGPYAYVANPMQVSMSLVLAGWGALLGNIWVTAGGAMAVVYSAGLAAWDEGQDLDARFGAPWREYRRHVRAWWPRWRPFVVPESDSDREGSESRAAGEPAPGERVTPDAPAIARGLAGSTRARARLYVASSCGQCSTLGRWIERQQPIGLTIVPAELHPARDLWRLTYDPGDGTRDESGIAALARALEHINLAWALAGMTMRLPLVRPCLQAIVDASGGGPQRIARTSCGVPGSSR